MKAEINVPESLSEITLEQYQAFLKVYDENDSEEFVSQKMISLFCKIPLSQVLYFKATSITDVLATLNGMFEGEKKLVQCFELGGKEFGFIPSLEDMTFGEYIDLETNISDWQNMHKAMAVMYRPITKTKKDQYDIEPYVGTANYSEVMKYAPMNVVMGAMVFFYHLGNELLRATLSYLETEVQLMSSAKSTNSVKRGDGISQSMQLLKETLQSLERLQSYPFLPVSHI